MYFLGKIRKYYNITISVLPLKDETGVAVPKPNARR